MRSGRLGQQRRLLADMPVKDGSLLAAVVVGQFCSGVVLQGVAMMNGASELGLQFNDTSGVVIVCAVYGVHLSDAGI